MTATRVLVTGAAGFIGYHLSKVLLGRGCQVVGIDNLNDYYVPQLKHDRVAQLRGTAGFSFQELELVDRSAVAGFFASGDFGPVVHLAAQAGVRYSLRNPAAYVDSNLVGFGNLLEGCRQRRTPHLLYASSSSVYGADRKLPFSVEDPVDHPVSFYAATKKANELMAHAYSHLFGLPCTGLRFFTVYGPWGRPDMAYWSFTEKILAGETIPVFNNGACRRDFTYIDDVVESVVRLIDTVPSPRPSLDEADRTAATSHAPWRVFNIGNHTPVELMRFIEILEDHIGKPASMEFLPLQPGDVEATYADVSALQAAVNFQPETPLEQGLGHFVRWFRDYHHC